MIRQSTYVMFAKKKILLFTPAHSLTCLSLNTPVSLTCISLKISSNLVCVKAVFELAAFFSEFQVIWYGLEDVVNAYSTSRYLSEVLLYSKNTVESGN